MKKAKDLPDIPSQVDIVISLQYFRESLISITLTLNIETLIPYLSSYYKLHINIGFLSLKRNERLCLMTLIHVDALLRGT